MGTTAQKLQAVLNAKNAIKEKFGLPDNLPFSQYADNIKGGGGGETAFYKCDSVESEKTILYTVRGAGYALANGGYWDTGETYSDGGTAAPILTNGTCFMRYGNTGMTWSIFDSYSNGTWGNELYCLEGESDPTNTHWFEINGETPIPCVSEGTSINPRSPIDVGRAGDGMYEGRYTISSGTSEGYDRYWGNSTGTGYLGYDSSTSSWCITFMAEDYSTVLYRGPANAENPWDGGEWVVVTGSSPAPPVQYLGAEDESDQPEDEEPKQTWSGYKAVLVTETEPCNVLVAGVTGNYSGEYVITEIENPNGVSDAQKRVYLYTVRVVTNYLYYDATRSAWCIKQVAEFPADGNIETPDYQGPATAPENPWEGGEWLLSDGTPFSVTPASEPKTKKYYTFEETLTTGLTYGYGFTPEVGKVYDAEAMIQATLYSEAQLPEALWATDFSSLTDFTVEGSVTSSTDSTGRAFANFNSGRLKFNMSKLPQANSRWTMAFGVRNLKNYGDGVCFFNGGTTPGYDGLIFTGVEDSSGGVFVWGWSGDRLTCPTSILNKTDWTRVLMTYDGSTAAIYLNGVKDVEGAVYVNITGTTCAFGGSFWGSYNLKADLADFKVWGSVLTQDEIALDYDNFK